MDFLIIAKSRGGWGVALGSDVLREFAEVAAAQAYAAELADLASAAGRPTDVIDLSEANGGGALAP